MGKAVSVKVDELKKSAELTPELNKKLADSRKSLRDSGMKGKELMQAVNEKAGLSETQVAAMTSIKKMQASFQKDVVALLTEEQKENLPKRLLKSAKGKGKGKGKKEKAEA